MTLARSLSISQLDKAAIDLENSAAQRRFETMCIRALADAALVLDRPEIVTCCLRLLESAPDSAFFDGAIANFEFPTKVPAAMRSTTHLEELQKQFPTYDKKRVLTHIKSESDMSDCMRPCALCIDDKIAAARKLSIERGSLHEVAATLCVMGDFASAAETLDLTVLEESRRSEILIVMAIELLRHNCDEQFRLVMTKLESGGLSPWERILLALGFANRVPWRGYPFSDW